MKKRYLLLIISGIVFFIAGNPESKASETRLPKVNSEKVFDIQNISVFGTDLITSDDIASSYSEVLLELAELHRIDKEKFNIKRDEFINDLKTKFGFSYSNLQLFKSYVGKVYFIFDFVTKADSSSRLSFR